MTKVKKSTGTPIGTSGAIAFCESLSSMLRAGISATEALELMQEEENAQECLPQLIEIYTATGSLFRAMEETGAFPPYLIHMTQLGEETGTLDVVMASLVGHYTREEELKTGIRSAITYPAVMIGMMLVVIGVLMVEVLPIFNQVFLQLGSEMSGLGRVLMEMGRGLKNESLVFALFLVILIGFGYSLSRWTVLRQKLGNRLPFFRFIREKTSACRLADTLSLSLKSGISPEEGLEMARQILEDPFFLPKVDACQAAMNAGSDLGPALLEAGIYSGQQARMITIGYKTGTLDGVMEDIASKCQNQVDERIAGMLAILEPSLVALLSILVGGILLTVMLPLLGIMSSL